MTGLGDSTTEQLTDSTFRNASAFFRVAEVPIDHPLDVDGDGIDDVFEIRNSHFLNPLNPSDSAPDFDGNGKSNLDDYKIRQSSQAIESSGYQDRFAVGWNHILAIRSDGTLWAWGENDKGQIGDGTLDAKTFPVQIGEATNWEFVAANVNASFAIDASG